MWPFRRKAQPVQRERSNPLRIAVLEHDLLGIKPLPGSMAAAVVVLRQAGTCLKHSPVEVTGLGDAGRTALCTRCGHHLVMDQHGQWGTA